MYESFISDLNIFSNEFSSFIDTSNRPAILYKIKQKHIGELEDDLNIEDKKIDLYIWNAIFSKEIIRHGISKKYLHTLYNEYYVKIPTLNDLKSLQELEIEMAEAYLEFLISDIEVKDNFIVNKLLQHLHMNIESFMSLEKISEHLGITPEYASTCFKKHMGISLMKYSKKIKIDRAKVLLTTTNKSMLDIALSLGFYDQSHFSRTFKSFVGMSPSEFRNTHYN
ncbi:helix-turn-helix transcriptional regulator [uncultured Clostridium sp.]|uniref:helix-turn-helix transcriptional regulator n=1 Tax=uncultured Clostridium sp. TaxID=59620 RepID=UPI0025F02BAD|nr:helix-turn-helix transcriptional regulator [uncultured Clostridium sp.]